VQPTTGPGAFEPIPFTSTPVDVKLQQVRPLSFDDPSSFRPGGPYSLTSRAYTADFNEVKALGRVDSPTRTPEQTETVRFWTEHTMIQFNRTVRNLAMAKRLGTVETARLMAMVHVSGADSAVSCWDAKYYYDFWRPQHAIQRADTDGNPDTVQDTTWTHLFLGNHPEYPSGHACFTSGVTRALAEYFGTDKVRLSIDSTVAGTTIHDFTRLSDVRKEVTVARIYGGLHFRKAMIDGEQIGRDVTKHLFRNFFDERKHDHDHD
jgi:PAP2 superfamily